MSTSWCFRVTPRCSTQALGGDNFKALAHYKLGVDFLSMLAYNGYISKGATPSNLGG